MEISLKDIEYQDLHAIVNEMTQDDSFFQLSFGGLALKFLQRFYSDDIFKLEFCDLRDKFISISGYDDQNVPTTKNDFYYFICSEFLDLTSEPIRTFTQLSLEVCDDLKEINDRQLKYIQNITSLNKEKPDDYGYKIYQLDYLINKLSLAKEEIINFLANGIKSYALKKARQNRSFGVTGWLEAPYMYRRNKESYTLEIFLIISNKFKKLSIKDYHSIKELLKTDYEEFKTQTKEYISKYDIIEDLEFKITDNHRLSERCDIISEALDAYTEKKYATFCHVIAIQIEGILFDLCLELGISERQIDKLSLEKKLQLIKEKDETFLYYEYFAYNFPIIRNTVAHGRLLNNEELEHLSDLLLLDLDCVCNLLFSKSLPVNQILDSLDKFENSDHPDKSSFAVIKYLYEYPDYDIQSIYSSTKNTIDDIDKYTHTQRFWNYIKQHISITNELSVLNGFEKVIKVINKKEIMREECVNCLKMISQNKSCFNEVSEIDDTDNFLNILLVSDYPYL